MSSIKIFVCTKGKKCPKRGSQDVCTAFEQAVRDTHSEDSITVKGTKCLDECKTGPSVVVMPDKVKYAGVSPQDAPEIVRAHLDGKTVKRLRRKKKRK
jgi:(2Fe-2S) ferredoxin